MPAAQRAGKTALILAAESGSLDAVKALLASKCDAAAVTPVICAPTCSRSWRSSESVGNQRLQKSRDSKGHAGDLRTDTRALIS